MNLNLKKINFNSFVKILLIFCAVVTTLGANLIYLFDSSFLRNEVVLVLWIMAIICSLTYKLVGLKNVQFKIGRKDIILAAIILLAIFLRFYAISNVPLIYQDEARDSGLIPQQVLKGEVKDFWGQGPYGIPNTFFLVAAIPHLLFGKTIFSLRFFSAFFGVLAVLITYLLAKQLFNRQTAIFSSALLSCYHVHLHFSRSEFINNFDSFWAPLIILTLTYSLKNSSFILGLVSGLSLHFYQGIRATVFASGLYWAISTFFKPTIKIQKKIIKYLNVTLGVLIGLGPTIVIILARREEFFNTGTANIGLVENGDFSLKLFFQNTIKTWGSIFYYPIDFHYPYGGPFLTTPLNLFFLVGIIYLFVRIKKRSSQILLLWLISVLFFNSIILVNQNFTHRLLGLVPALLIVCSVGLNKFLQLIKSARLRIILAAMVVSISCLLNIKTYFYDQVWKNAYGENMKIAAFAGHYTSKIQEPTKIYFLENPDLKWDSIASWPYLKSDAVKVENISDELTKKLINNIIAQDKNSIIFIIPQDRDDEQEVIKDMFDITIEKHFYFDDELLFTAFEINQV